MNHVATDAFVRRASRKASQLRKIARQAEFETPQFASADGRKRPSHKSRGDLMRGLKDKRVLITGGASGIGAATAARFLEEGSRVCVLDRDDAAGARIKHELPALGEAILA